jgi:hypothetical protein
MRRVLPLVVLAAGCAGPDQLQPDPAALPTADLRELELKRNLRDGVSWDEQERRIADAKSILTPAAGADATGPRSK